MKRTKWPWALALFFVFSFFPLYSLYATVFRMMGATDLAAGAKTPGSGAVHCKIQSVVEKSGYREVTCEVQEVLVAKQGPFSTATHGQPIVLRFPTASSSYSLRRAMIAAPEYLTPGQERIFFVTTNIRGEHFIIGGREQGDFFVTNVGGKTSVYNLMNNRNILSDPQLRQSGMMQRVIQGMQENNTGTIPLSQFKQLLSQ